ncbi:MAG: DNA polymerase I [Anaerolineae bacterium]
MSSRPLLVIVDGHSLLYRAFHGVPDALTSRQGEPTNAIYGFTTMLLNVLRDWHPTYALVAMDVGRSFRHEAAEEYKANRAQMPDSLRMQLERARELLEALRIPAVGMPGWEADDIIGAVAEQAKSQGIEVLIVTGDTDALQLVDGGVRVLTPGRRFSDPVVYDRERVVQRYGLQPEQLVDYKALVGDKSDNVAGVRGIGEKTAAELLQKYGTLEGIYEHLDEIQNARARRALQEGREEAFRSRDLVTIRRDVPLTLDLDQCCTGRGDSQALDSLFRELDFRSLMGRLPEVQEQAPEAQGQLSLFDEEEAPVQEASVPATTEYEVVDSVVALEKLAAKAAAAESIAIDVESDALNPVSAGLVGISLALEPGKGYYIPVGHRTEGDGNLDLDVVRKTLGPVLEDPFVQKVAHNSKFDWEMLSRFGLLPSGPDFDTMVAEWLVNPDQRTLGLKALAWGRLGMEMTPITDIIGKGKKQISMADCEVRQVAPYAAADADATLRLRPILEAELRERKQWDLFQNVEMPLVPVLAEMELRGVRIDVEYLKQFSAELEQRLEEITTQIRMLAGYPVNVNSTQQLSDLLFQQLKLPCGGLRRTASGHYSTAAEVLEGLRGEHEVVDLILEHRQLSKLKSTYAEALPTLVNPTTGRVHTSYNQTATVTGRLSSSEPNLQNIPIRTELGRRIRRAFTAEPGNLLIGADYSQVELRILAHVSQDPNLLRAFAEGLDIHSSTASLTYGVPIEEVTPEMRRISKTVNFAVIYGVSAFGLARQSDLNEAESRQFIEAYFRNYPKVREYIEGVRSSVARKGYVETLLGRRRYFPQLVSGERLSRVQRAELERAAINMPIQGTAADIIKIAMIRLSRELKERGLESRMILQVHDELVLEGPEHEVETVVPLVREVMENAFALDAPLKVDVAVGPNWLEAKE